MPRGVSSRRDRNSPAITRISYLTYPNAAEQHPFSL
jgi:hypothetical protein